MAEKANLVQQQFPVTNICIYLVVFSKQREENLFLLFLVES
jgi:hypothetical protein